MSKNNRTLGCIWICTLIDTLENKATYEAEGIYLTLNVARYDDNDNVKYGHSIRNEN